MASDIRATAQSPTIGTALSEKRSKPEAVLDHIGEGDDLIVGMFNSEPLGGEYWSSSGGRPDFARGALFSEYGQSLIVLHSTTADESASRIVDRIVTEYGVAELRGSSIRERTRRLIGIAHPKFRDELERQAREMDYL